MIFRFQNQIIKILLFSILMSVSSSCGLSIPNLESPECIEARNNVKEFYSFHFGNEMNNSPENLRLREKFLSPELMSNLSGQTQENFDYFTQTENFPKAFSIAGCQTISSEKTLFRVLLFWKDDYSSEQREVKVEAVKKNGEWLINKVEK